MREIKSITRTDGVEFMVGDLIKDRNYDETYFIIDNIRQGNGRTFVTFCDAACYNMPGVAISMYTLEESDFTKKDKKNGYRYGHVFLDRFGIVCHVGDHVKVIDTNEFKEVKCFRLKNGAIPIAWTGNGTTENYCDQKLFGQFFIKQVLLDRGLDRMKESIIEITMIYDQLCRDDEIEVENSMAGKQMICQIAEEFEEKYQNQSWAVEKNDPDYYETINKFARERLLEEFPTSIPFF